MKSTIIFFLLFCCVHVHGQRKVESSFAMPKIKKFKYLLIPTALKNIFLVKSCQDSIFRFLKSYHKRLADIREYEVYLLTQNCFFNISRSNCIWPDEANQLVLEFLLLYNKKLKQASVVVASYNFLSDSEVYDMSFKIKGDEIVLMESGTTEGEGGKPEIFLNEIHTVKVLKPGKSELILGNSNQ